MSRRSARILAAVAVFLATVPLAGCGPSAEERFRKEKLGPAQKRIERDKSQIAAQLRVVHLGRKRDSKIVEQQVDTLAGAVASLRALKPPGSVADEFQRFGVAHEHLVVSLRRFAAALGDRSEARLNAAAAKAQSAAGEVARARDALQAGLAKN